MAAHEQRVAVSQTLCQARAGSRVRVRVTPNCHRVMMQLRQPEAESLASLSATVPPDSSRSLNCHFLC